MLFLYFMKKNQDILIFFDILIGTYQDFER